MDDHHVPRGREPKAQTEGDQVNEFRYGTRRKTMGTQWLQMGIPGRPPRRRAVPQGGNIDFICWYLFHNPGARFTQILRALCEFNNVPYRNGQYSDYFSSHGETGRRCVGPIRSLWQKVGPGWVLTLDGLARFGDHCQEA
jgi:hypothetical protein